MRTNVGLWIDHRRHLGLAEARPHRRIRAEAVGQVDHLLARDDAVGALDSEHELAGRVGLAVPRPFEQEPVGRRRDHLVDEERVAFRIVLHVKQQAETAAAPR